MLRDGLSLFGLTSGASTAPTADTDSTVRSQWTTRDAAARLAVQSHLPSTERTHFSQYKSAKTLYDVVVARYSSPATAALSRLMLPYLFPGLAAFATVADLITHLRASDARYRAALPAETTSSLCHVCVPPDPGIEAAALGASESAAPDAGESALSDRTTLTPLCRPVAVSRADPSGGPVLARYSTVLPCPAAPSGSLSGLYLPSFSTKLTLLWHHRLGHPSLPRLRGMASRVLVSSLPQSLPPLPPGPAPTCVPCVEGRQRAAPQSSEFPPTEAPLQTLHMDVWGPARVRGRGHERYFLLVVDDYSRYTTVSPLRRKDAVTEVLIDWIHVARLQLRERFGSNFPVLRLHSDRGGEFSSDLLRAFCRAEGIWETFTLPASPQQNGIAERCIGMVMDVARTSMIHAAAPHFLWPFAVQYAAHQINLLWTGKIGDA
ncbi:unnamed protein product [Closterium sp. NIES-53]